MRRLLTTATAALILAGCSDTPAGPDFDEFEVPAPAFDIHTSPTAGQLDDPSDAYDEVTAGTYAQRAQGGFNGDRQYMRTVATDFIGKDFTAELVFTMDNWPGDNGVTIHFFGIGPGVPNPSQGFNEPTGVFFRIHAPNAAGGSVGIAATRADGSPSGFFPPPSLGSIPASGGEHRVIITRSGNVATFELDLSNDNTIDGSFTLFDLNAATDNTLDGTNSRIFFGTSDTDQFTPSIEAASSDPTSVDQCKKGGWQDFGFRNQGQCIRFVNTGKDSR